MPLALDSGPPLGRFFPKVGICGALRVQCRTAVEIARPVGMKRCVYC